MRVHLVAAEVMAHELKVGDVGAVTLDRGVDVAGRRIRVTDGFKSLVRSLPKIETLSAV